MRSAPRRERPDEGRNQAEGSASSKRRAIRCGADSVGPRRIPSGCVVLKIGGRALEGPTSFRDLARDLRGLLKPVLLVHGGGAEVSAWCAKLGLKPLFHEGLRVTDPETLEVAAAVLAGLANSRHVARLREAGVDAVGLSALDGGLIEVVPHPQSDRLGRVGHVAGVRAELLGALFKIGKVPVVASIGAYRGDLLNLNADDVAGALAGALEADALILLSDVPHVVLNGRPVTLLEGCRLADVLNHPDVQDGMRPKLRAAQKALGAGVKRVHISAWQGPGTLPALLSGCGASTAILAGDPVESHAAR